MIPSSASFSKDSEYSDVGSADAMRDQSENTYKGASTTTVTSYRHAYFQVNFDSWTGPTPTKIYACIISQTTLQTNVSATLQYYTGGWSNVASLATTSAPVQHKFLISGLTAVPTALRVDLNTGALPASGSKHHDSYEMWPKVEYTGSSSSAADGVWGNPNEVVAPLVTCDVQGYADAGAGAYTGSANALIENPSDVRRHFLIVILGRSSSEIGSSFGAIRTTYANRITGGYKFGMILYPLGLKPSEILKTMDFSSRSNLREDGGKFELTFNDTADPTAALTVDDSVDQEMENKRRRFPAD